MARLRYRRQEDFSVASGIRLNRDAFAEYCTLRELKTLEAKAQFVGVNASTLSRIMNGSRGVGEGFIAHVIDAFAAVGMRPGRVFEALFETYNDDLDEVA